MRTLRSITLSIVKVLSEVRNKPHHECGCSPPALISFITTIVDVLRLRLAQLQLDNQQCNNNLDSGGEQNVQLLLEHCRSAFTYLDRMRPLFAELEYVEKCAPHRLALVAFILADKYHNDFCFHAADWLALVCGYVPTHWPSMVAMEVSMLDFLKWELGVTAEEKEDFDCIIFPRRGRAHRVVRPQVVFAQQPEFAREDATVGGQKALV